jgi:phospholipase/carboxylesterase
MVVDQEGELRYRVRDAAGEPAGALVLLHGRGADENDLFPLFDLLDPARRLLGIALRGPLTLPGLPGAHWYVIAQPGFPSPTTFLPTAAAVERWLEEIPDKFGVPLDKVVLGGFSQGAVMTYGLSLHAPRKRPPAFVALSGFMPTVEGFELQLSNLRGLPVAIGHGVLDPVIEVDWSRDAKKRLEAAGASVLYRESPMGHTIDPSFLGQLVPWLEEIVPG